MSLNGEIEPHERPYRQALERGELVLQRCSACGNAWLPARQECPGCLSSDTKWEVASGGASLISWVVYRRAMHADFTDDVPYNVAVVELDEGARLISNINAPESDLRIGARLTFAAAEKGGVAMTSFLLS